MYTRMLIACCTRPIQTPRKVPIAFKPVCRFNRILIGPVLIAHHDPAAHKYLGSETGVADSFYSRPRTLAGKVTSPDTMQPISKAGAAGVVVLEATSGPERAGAVAGALAWTRMHLSFCPSLPLTLLLPEHDNSNEKVLYSACTENPVPSLIAVRPLAR